MPVSEADLALLTCFASDPAIVSKLTDECQALLPLVPNILQGESRSSSDTGNRSGKRV